MISSSGMMPMLLLHQDFLCTAVFIDFTDSSRERDLESVGKKPRVLKSNIKG